MVTGLVKGRQIEIKNLDDLASVVETTRRAHESLILIGDQDARVKVDPKERNMVAALVKGKRVPIENLDDLMKVVESAIAEMDTLVIFGDHDERLEIGPAAELSEEEKRNLFLSTRGSWKGLVDVEQLKHNIYESRGQKPRSWMIAESGSDEE